MMTREFRWSDRGSWGRRMLAGAAVGLALLAGAACEQRDRKVDLSKHLPFGQMPDVVARDWPLDPPSDVVVLHIEKFGKIRIGLYSELAPKTVAHFKQLAREGVYDGSLFHRIIKDFMVQGGNPYTRVLPPGEEEHDFGDLYVEDELTGVPQVRGVVSMANKGKPGTAASQFFVLQMDARELDGKYTAFGRVISGMDVVDAMAAVETDEYGRWGERDTPLGFLTLERVEVEGVGLYLGVELGVLGPDLRPRG